MQTNKPTTSSGYAILFTILLISIILAITIGIANISLKELNFTATAKSSQISFFAADSAGECALFAVKHLDILNTPPPTMKCDTQQITGIPTTIATGITRYNFNGFATQDNTGCANVDITLDNSNAQSSSITVNSHGFNVSCANFNSAPGTRVERELSYVFSTTYGGGTGATATGGPTTSTTSGGATGSPFGPIIPPPTGTTSSLGTGTLTTTSGN